MTRLAAAVAVAAFALILLAPQRAAAAAGLPVPFAPPVPFPVPPIIPPALPLANPVTAAGDVVGGLAKASANTVLDAVSGWVADGAASLLGGVAHVIDTNASPTDTAPWFGPHFTLMIAVAAQLALPLLVAVAITAVVRRDIGLLGRAAFVHLPLALIGTGAGMTIVGLAVSATDGLCAYVAKNAHTDAAALLRNLILALAHGGPNVTGFGLVLVSLLIAMGGFFLTIELVVREAAIWVALLFLPLGFVAAVWPATARWGRRLAELLVALILSKFVIVAIVTMAFSATSAGFSDPALGPLFGGAALLLLAAAAPFTLLKMVPVVEASVVAHLEGVGRRAVTPPAPVQQIAQSQVRRMLEQRGSTGAAPNEPASPVGGDPAPVAVPTRGRDADGTQAGPDKPAPGWRNGVRMVPGPAGGGASGGTSATGGSGGASAAAAAGGAVIV